MGRPAHPGRGLTPLLLVVAAACSDESAAVARQMQLLVDLGNCRDCSPQVTLAVVRNETKPDACLLLEQSSEAAPLSRSIALGSGDTLSMFGEATCIVDPTQPGTDEECGDAGLICAGALGLKEMRIEMVGGVAELERMLCREPDKELTAKCCEAASICTGELGDKCAEALQMCANMFGIPVEAILPGDPSVVFNIYQRVCLEGLPPLDESADCCLLLARCTDDGPKVEPSCWSCRGSTSTGALLDGETDQISLVLKEQSSCEGDVTQAPWRDKVGALPRCEELAP